MMLATTALIMPITPAAVTVGKPHWTVEVETCQTSALKLKTSLDLLNLNREHFCFYVCSGDFYKYSEEEEAAFISALVYFPYGFISS